MREKIVILPNLTLFVALALSAIAAYYSIIGLTAIFAGAIIPIIVMGVILEVAKLVTTVWLKTYWEKCGFILKVYLVPAVVILMLITSMGIFGFLSKSHLDQGVSSGDVAAKIAIYDEKIKTARENIDGNRRILKQMDESVDQVMGRSTDEKGADKAVAIRKAQGKERTRLLDEITTEQKTISNLNEQRAPIAAEVRKVEAEVGPIKYIAALIYSDSPDSNILEKAVRWVIVLLVVVFDPLAVALILAANQSKAWEREVKVEEATKAVHIEDEPGPIERTKYEADDGPLTEEQIEQVKESVIAVDTLAYLKKPFVHFTGTQPMVAKPVTHTYESATDQEETDISDLERPGDYLTPPEEPVVIITDGVTKEVIAPSSEYLELDGGYVSYNGKHMNKNVLKDMRPDLFKLSTADARSVSTNFGTTFPTTALRGDVFVRVDVLPNRVYKFDGSKWMIINKEQTDTYLHNQEYIKYLVAKIDSGEYDIDLITDHEKQQIEEYLNQKT
jgi:hypothetical protein